MRRPLACTVMILCVAAADASAQLPGASTRALGMGDNYTAAARAHGAIAWNPALLALPDNPSASIAVLPVRGVAGLAPVGLADLSDWQGQSIPNEVREQWLRQVERRGREAGSAGGDATYFAAQRGRMGVQLSSTLHVAGVLSPGGAELLFFGNAGRTGEPRTLDVDGSKIRAHAASTIALSYAVPLRGERGRALGVGATVKYTVGHMLLLGNAAGSSVAEDPAVNLQFPTAGTSLEGLRANAGSGIGLDVGFSTQSGSLTVGAVVQNLVNTFAWDARTLEFREGLARFDQTTTTTDFAAQSFGSAPADLRRAVAAARFPRVLAAGAALEASERLLLAGDLRLRVGHTTLAEPADFHLGGGAEYRPMTNVLLRAGGALIAHGYQLGGGVGVTLGPLQLGASLLQRDGEYGSGRITMVTLLSSTTY